MGRVIVVFPHSGLHSALADNQRRWLSRGQVTLKPAATEPLDDVLTEIGLPRLHGGHAALRYLGQTGREVDGWVAAADPVSFEPRMRDIVAHRVPQGQLATADLESVFAAAQDVLAAADTMKFETIGNYGYLHSTRPMSTATVSPTSLHGYSPEEYLPTGDEGRSFHRIHGELQMLFHEHAVNASRTQRGLPAINGLWIWGGGRMPQPVQQDLPDLLGDDPLFSGYWKKSGGRCRSWHGNIADSIRAAGGSLVIIAPGSADDSFDREALRLLDQIGELILHRRMTKLTMIFNNEACVRLRWSDRFRIWRQPSELQPKSGHYE